MNGTQPCVMTDRPFEKHEPEHIGRLKLVITSMTPRSPKDAQIVSARSCCQGNNHWFSQNQLSFEVVSVDLVNRMNLPTGCCPRLVGNAM
jgi:hypothetical protein